MEHHEPEGFMPPRALPSCLSQSDFFVGEEETHRDLELSDDEGLMPDQPVFVGLFRPSLFRFLLFKAKKAANMGGNQTMQEAAPGSGDPADSIIPEPAAERVVVPAPRLFLDVVQRQCTSPWSGSYPNS